MSLIYVGKLGKKKVFITPYSQKRLQQRNLTKDEVLHLLRKRDISYPVDEDGRQKIRTTLSSGKQAFLTVMEDEKRIIVITGGESNAPA